MLEGAQRRCALTSGQTAVIVAGDVTAAGVRRFSLATSLYRAAMSGLVSAAR
jgi:hypothetical protein